MYPALVGGRFDRWPLCDPLIGPKQTHALFLRMTQNRVFRLTVSTVRINVFITPAVRERTDLPTSSHRQTPTPLPQAQAPDMCPHGPTAPRPCAPSCWQVPPPRP